MTKVKAKNMPFDLMVQEIFVSLSYSDDMIRKSSLAQLLATAMRQVDSREFVVTDALNLTQTVENYFK